MSKYITSKSKFNYDKLSIKKFFSLLKDNEDLLSFERDNQGQIIVYTGMNTDENGDLIVHDPD